MPIITVRGGGIAHHKNSIRQAGVLFVVDNLDPFYPIWYNIIEGKSIEM